MAPLDANAVDHLGDNVHAAADRARRMGVRGVVVNQRPTGVASVEFMFGVRHAVHVVDQHGVAGMSARLLERRRVKGS